MYITSIKYSAFSASYSYWVWMDLWNTKCFIAFWKFLFIRGLSKGCPVGVYPVGSLSPSHKQPWLIWRSCWNSSSRFLLTNYPVKQKEERCFSCLWFFSLLSLTCSSPGLSSCGCVTWQLQQGEPRAEGQRGSLTHQKHTRIASLSWDRQAASSINLQHSDS